MVCFELHLSHGTATDVLCQALNVVVMNIIMTALTHVISLDTVCTHHIHSPQRCRVLCNTMLSIAASRSIVGETGLGTIVELQVTLTGWVLFEWGGRYGVRSLSVCVCVCVFVHACVHACMCVHKCAHTFTFTHTHTLMPAPYKGYSHAHVWNRTGRMYLCLHTHLYMYMYLTNTSYTNRGHTWRADSERALILFILVQESHGSTHTVQYMYTCFVLPNSTHNH